MSNSDFSSDFFDHECECLESKRKRKHDFDHECECLERKRKRKQRSKCDKCACDQLKHLHPGTEVDVYLSGGVVLEDVVFKDFDPFNCCATFKDVEGVEAGTTLFVDCRDIQALRIE